MTEDELKAIETRASEAYERHENALEQEQRDDIRDLVAEVRRLRAHDMSEELLALIVKFAGKMCSTDLGGAVKIIDELYEVAKACGWKKPEKPTPA